MRNIFKRDNFLLFSDTGRLDRISFAIASFGMVAVYTVLFSILFCLFSLDGIWPMPTEAFFCVGFFWLLICAYIFSNLIVKRAHDIGLKGGLCRFMAGVWGVFYFLNGSQEAFFQTLFGRGWKLWAPLSCSLSFLLIAAALFLLLWPGKKGDNAYGSQPERWHCTGRFGE